MLLWALVNSPWEKSQGPDECWGYWQAQCCVSLQEEKVYVQHRIQENRRLVWELLTSRSAHVYLAG